MPESESNNQSYQELLSAELLKVEKQSQQLAGWLLVVTIIVMNVIAQLQHEGPYSDFLNFATSLSIGLVIWFAGTSILIAKGFYHYLFKYLNLILQVSTVTFFMLTAARLVDADFALSSTAPLLYLLVIGLSSLSLNPMLSLLAGGFAAGQFVGSYALWMQHDTLMPMLDSPREIWAQILLKAIIFIIMGVGAMLIARLSRKLLERMVSQVSYEEQIRFIEQDMQLAAEIQEKLIPIGKIPPTDFNIETFYSPARQVGGDYFDILPAVNGKCVVVIADVSGKGYSAALLMSNIQAIVKSIISQSDNLLQLVKVLNTSVCNTSVRGKFVTLVCMELDPMTNRIRYINCGHNPPVVISSQSRVEALDQAGPVLGVVPDFEYTVHEIDFPESSILLAYTDGLTELKNKDGIHLGLDRIIEVLHKLENLYPDIVKQLILALVFEHLSDADFTDDLSFVCVQKSPGKPGQGLLPEETWS